MQNNIINILKFFTIIGILICAVIAIFLILNIAPFEELNEALRKGLFIIITLAITSAIVIFVLKTGKSN